MLVHELNKSTGFHRSGKRLWRGNASGKGNYSGKWCKGQKARAGWGVPSRFEWGQTPLYMRLPKLRWFKQPKHLQSTIQTVTLNQLERHEKITTEVTKELLASCGFIKSVQHPVKILATGTLTKALKCIDVEYYSAGARQAIEKAGGTCTE